MDSALKKLKAARGKGSQGRIDSFFTVQPKQTGEGEGKGNEKEKSGKRKGVAGKEVKGKAGAGSAKKVKK